MRRIAPFSAALTIVLVVVGSACGEATDPVATSIAGAPAPVPPVSTGPTSTTSSADSTQPDEIQPEATQPEATQPATTLAPIVEYAVEEIVDFDGFAIAVSAAPDGDGVLVALKDGRIFSVVDGAPTLALDIRDLVRDSGERGLLGMALHPDFAATREIFVHYSDRDGDTTLARYTAVEAGIEFDSASGSVLLSVEQPAGNHNGGMLAFGPDGNLYLGLGDGGGAGDRFGQGQRTDTLLAAILRIDPDGAEPYVIPPDNPFVDGGGAPEVWAYGLRNPFRFAFDDGLLYVADVGQNAFEEIDVVQADSAGLNYGWPITEGLHCFTPRTGCDASGLTLPVLEVEHGDGGTCSITGGVVYRGSSIPEINGHYLYSDFCGGYLRAFRFDGGQAVDQQELLDDVGAIASFGADADGEVLMTLSNGKVLRLIARR